VNIIDLVLNGKFPDPFHGIRFSEAGEELYSREDVQRIAREGVRVDIQNIVDSYVRQGQYGGDLPTVTAMSPWSECCLFFRRSGVPTCIVITGHQLSEAEAAAASGAGHAIMAAVFVTNKEESTAAPIGAIGVLLDADGIEKETKAGAIYGTKNVELAEKMLTENVFYMLTAFAFCHCKNVEVKLVRSSRQVRRYAERHGQPLYENHVIEIEQIRKILDGEGGYQEHGNVLQALHICRGHFAKYGEKFGKKKLFGKYEGQFFFPQHLRGSKEKGVVRTDYKLGVPEEKA
jgi:hypothetical protein